MSACPVRVKLRKSHSEHFSTAVPQKATAGGSLLQISPWHGAFSASPLPRQSAREAPGKRLARGPLGWAAGAGKPLYGLPCGRAKQGSVG